MLPMRALFVRPGKKKMQALQFLNYISERCEKMRSDAVKTGTAQAPHRSLFNALGYTEEERRRPLIGIVCSYNEIVPGHMNLDKIAEAVKMGVAMAGGPPLCFLPSRCATASPWDMWA